MIQNTIWYEKYRPKTIDDFIGNAELKEKITLYLNTNDIPHLLLYGQPGGGKTSLAKIIAESIAGENFMYINASDENGIDTVRDKIKQFASSIGFGGLKIIVCDEFDGFTPQGQEALRNTMEKYSKTTRFILTCNYIDRVIPPIKSRCQSYNLIPPSKPDVALLCSKILENENVKYDAGDLVKIVNQVFPDIRLIIGELQKNSIDGKLQFLQNTEDKLSVYNNIFSILTSNKTNIDKIREIRQILADSLLRDYNPLFRYLYDSAEKLYPSSPGTIILIVADAQYKDAFVIDHEINAMSAIIQIINELKH